MDFLGPFIFKASISSSNKQDFQTSYDSTSYTKREWDSFDQTFKPKVVLSLKLSEEAR